MSEKAPLWLITEVVPGMNNLLLVFNPETLCPLFLRNYISECWPELQPSNKPSRTIEIPVVYGGSSGSDLPDVAKETGLSIDQLVRLHSEAQYTVACLGGMPGFIYLSGLPTKLCVPRRAIPSPGLERGSIIIGGAQAGIMPISAPSGWHSIGHTKTITFDAALDVPCLFLPGDSVRFSVLGVLA